MPGRQTSMSLHFNRSLLPETQRLPSHRPSHCVSVSLLITVPVDTFSRTCAPTPPRGYVPVYCCLAPGWIIAVTIMLSHGENSADENRCGFFVGLNVQDDMSHSGCPTPCEYVVLLIGCVLRQIRHRVSMRLNRNESLWE